MRYSVNASLIFSSFFSLISATILDLQVGEVYGIEIRTKSTETADDAFDRFLNGNLYDPPDIFHRFPNCGTNKNRASTIGTKVKNGDIAINDWAWMAAIMHQSNQTLFCGGTLITDIHVMTAAHCFDRITENQIFVRLGEYNFQFKSENRLDIPVQKILKHEQYSNTKTRWENDIAILLLNRPTLLDENNQPACLPPSQITFEDRNGYVLGWGIHKHLQSNELRQAYIPVWNQNRCRNNHNINQIVNSMMCAGSSEGPYKNACSGDSGGPLTVEMQDQRRDKWYVIGVVSWGISTCTGNKPAVYTRVNHYLEWINKTTYSYYKI